MKKALLLPVFVVLLALESLAQQLPQYSQYLLNDFAVNPAVGGSKPYFEARTNIRNQWLGITDAPRTYVLSVHGPLKNQNMGIGGVLYTDITGPTRRIGLNISYAYHLKVADNTRLAFGLAGGLQQFAVDASKIKLRDKVDPHMGTQILSTVVPDFAFGIYFYHEKYFFSASAPQLLQNRLRLFEDVTTTELKLEDHYYVSAGYKFNFGENFQFEPSVMMKYVSPVPLQLDFSGRFIYKGNLWFGGTYRTMDAVAGIIGFNIQDNLMFGYSYDYALTNLQNYSTGTHEIMMGIKFIPNKGVAAPSIE